MNTTLTTQDSTQSSIHALTELVQSLLMEQGLLRAQVDTLYKEVESLRSQIKVNVK